MEHLGKTGIILLLLFAYLFYRLVKELAWIWVYTLIIKLKAEGKLIPENDPNNIESKIYNEVIKQTKSIL